jgi:hypothetical protein
MKRSDRDESIRVVIHMCMVAMLEISLNSYLYLKLAKTLCVLIIACVFSSTKLEKRAEQVLLEAGGWGGKGGDGGARVEKWPKQCVHI